MIWGLAAMALMSSCTDQKTAPTADNDTTSVAQDTASIDSMDLASIAGTYEAPPCRRLPGHQDRAHHPCRQHLPADAGLPGAQGRPRRGQRRAARARRQGTGARTPVEWRADLLQGEGRPARRHDRLAGQRARGRDGQTVCAHQDEVGR